MTLEPSLAAGTLGGLTYLEHYPYECTEQTMSRFLPNVVTYAALKELGVPRPDLDAKLPQQVGVGLQRIYAQQHVDGGWGWWQSDDSRVAVSSYVVFALAKAKQAGFTVDQTVLDRGVRYLTESLKAPKGLEPWQLNQQAFTLYALAEAGQMEPNRAGALYEAREGLSTYGKAYLAQALNLIDDKAAPARIKTLLADISGQAITSATSTHWEEALVGLLEHEHRHPHDVHRARHAGQARPGEQPGPQHRALADGRAQGRPLGDHPGERLGHHGADRLDGGHG